LKSHVYRAFLDQKVARLGTCQYLQGYMVR